MTLLDRWDKQLYSYLTEGIKQDEIRRALATAQAVEEWIIASGSDGHWIMRRADELLAGKREK